MVQVIDVAEYILQKLGPMTAMKLQKLVYYCQVWSLVWDEKPLFVEKFEAWANGPVCPHLYAVHRGSFELGTVGGEATKLTSTERETVDAVLKGYGQRTSQWLSDLTHQENPWRDARNGLSDGERGSSEITHAAMAEYYSALDAKRAVSLLA
jgi:uncharacterized phage-associated protein